jgi:hypothetical protein
MGALGAAVLASSRAIEGVLKIDLDMAVIFVLLHAYIVAPYVMSNAMFDILVGHVWQVATLVVAPAAIKVVDKITSRNGSPSIEAENGAK